MDLSHVDCERTLAILKCPANEARCKGVQPKSVAGSTSTSSSSRICRTTVAVVSPERRQSHLCDLRTSIARRHVKCRPVFVCRGCDIHSEVNEQLRKGPSSVPTREAPRTRGADTNLHDVDSVVVGGVMQHRPLVVVRSVDVCPIFNENLLRIVRANRWPEWRYRFTLATLSFP